MRCEIQGRNGTCTGSRKLEKRDDKIHDKGKSGCECGQGRHGNYVVMLGQRAAWMGSLKMEKWSTRFPRHRSHFWGGGLAQPPELRQVARSANRHAPKLQPGTAKSRPDNPSPVGQ